MPLINVTGIVLKCYDLGEADRIIVMLARDLGKLRIVAKGARRPGRRFAAVAQPLVELQAGVHTGRNLHTMNQAVILSAHRAVRDDLERLAYGMFMAELVERSTLDEQPQDEILELLSHALYSLENTDNNELLLAWFELQLLHNLGLLPVCEYCVKCHQPGRSIVGLNALHGGVICDGCRELPGTVPLGPLGVSLLTHFTAQGGEDYTVSGSADSANELLPALETFLFYQLDTRPKSYDFLNTLRALRNKQLDNNTFK